ncbi:N-glycosyltransferase [Actinopolyspora mzabensis]|uniref:N-glycosyltransferase n=1 Tax=Actinopolyspora mzabensis TaxID=995066 RepID=A0A1G8Z3L0_ACTMZ|nr:nucleotide disphospho-sugar-binding domain-containing protein [Actinopolyspora mzabensis]SDK09658.1 N-glycosyltransferase [Actinopolyspora mzabensis]
MRIAFSSQPVYSHLVPALLPLAGLAAEAGHEVGVLTSPELTEEVRAFGLTPLVLPNALGPREIFQRPETVERLGIDPSVMADLGRRTIRAEPDYFTRVFAGAIAGDTAEESIEALRSFGPDLLVREAADYPAYYAAEYLDVPHAVLDTGPLGPHGHEDLLTRINEQRERLGLPDVTDPLHPFRYRRLSMVPESFYPEHLRLESAVHYRAPRAAEQRLDPAIAELPGDRPLVLATLGSNAAALHDAGTRGLLDTIVEALGDLRVTGVVALGTGVNPEDWQGTRPDNVYLTSFVQQQLLLPTCDAFITHGGFGGIREALSSGVPMVVLPTFAEQPANADRVEQLGAGKRLDLENVSHDSLRTTVGTVLADSAHRHRARAIAREFLALPPFTEMVTELEKLFGQ